MEKIMAFVKRIFLFLALNFLVIFVVGLILRLFNIEPFLRGYGLNVPSLLIFCFVWGMSGALISLALSRIMAKWMMKIQLVNPQGTPIDPQIDHLIRSVKKLSQKAHIPLPEVGIYESNDVNAFATGPTQKRSLVAVSTGLLKKMKESEIEAVLGHEISHISNGDMVTMTLLQGVINAFVLFLSRILAFLLSGMGKSRDNRSSGNIGTYMLFTYIFDVLFMILGSMLVAAYSRYREFKADRGGAELAGKQSMIGALRALLSIQEQKKGQQVDNSPVAAFKISQKGKGGILRFFSTHPPLEERIERLENLCP
jgi:heat shock protein HtpX